MKITVTALIAILVLTTNAPVAFAQGERCSGIFLTRQSKKSEDQIKLESATKSLMAYKKSIGSKILEREFVIEPFLIALIAKEHLLMIGTPGTAKTELSKLLLSNIVDATTKQPSLYAMQMNKEITLSDTHGSINFKKLSEGIVLRNYEEGLLGAKAGFIDESFDIRPGAFRNILDVLAERAHSQGTKHFNGLTEIIIAATNKTLPEVYDEFNNSEQPRALIDRFAFVLFIPKEMESRLSDRSIFKGSKANNEPVHQLTYQDVDVIRALTSKVEIPDHLADLAAMIHYRLTPEFETREVKTMDEYREKIQNGEHALPPFRASKYLSPRTLAKAGNIMRAIVALDYAQSGGKRELTATIDDLNRLRMFYQMNGPSDQSLTTQLNRALKEYEKDQIKTVQLERSIVNPLFDSMIKQFNEAVARLNLHDLDQAVRDYKMLSTSDKRKVANHLKDFYQQSLHTMRLELKEDITAETIAVNAGQSIIKEYVAALWPDQANAVLASWEKQAGINTADLNKKLKEKIARKQVSYQLRNSAHTFLQFSLKVEQVKEEKRLAALREIEEAKRLAAEEKQRQKDEKLRLAQEEADRKSSAEAEPKKAAVDLANVNSPIEKPFLALNRQGTMGTYTAIGMSGDGERIFAQEANRHVFFLTPEGPRHFESYEEVRNVKPFGKDFLLLFDQEKLYGLDKTQSTPQFPSNVGKIRFVASTGTQVYAFGNSGVYMINQDHSFSSAQIAGENDFIIAAPIPRRSSINYVTVARAKQPIGEIQFRRVIGGVHHIYKSSDRNLDRFLQEGDQLSMINETQGIIFKDQNVMGFELKSDGSVRFAVRWVGRISSVVASPDGRVIAEAIDSSISVYNSSDYFNGIFGAEIQVDTYASGARPEYLQFSSDGRKLLVADDNRFQVLDVSNGVPSKSQGAQPTANSGPVINGLRFANISSGSLAGEQKLLTVSNDGQYIKGTNSSDQLQTIKDGRVFTQPAGPTISKMVLMGDQEYFVALANPNDNLDLHFLNKVTGEAVELPANVANKRPIQFFSVTKDKAYLFRGTYLEVVDKNRGHTTATLSSSDPVIAAAGIPNLEGVNYAVLSKAAYERDFKIHRHLDSKITETFTVDFEVDAGHPSSELYMADESRGLVITENSLYSFAIGQDGKVKTTKYGQRIYVTALSPDGKFIAMKQKNALGPIIIFNSAEYIDGGPGSAQKWEVITSIGNIEHLQFSNDGSKILIADKDKFEVFDIKEEQ